MVGRRQYLEEMFKASVQVGKPHHSYKDTVWLEIRNRADIDIVLERAGGRGPRSVTLPANSTTILRTNVNPEATQAKLRYLVKNFLIGPEKGLPVELLIALR